MQQTVTGIAIWSVWQPDRGLFFNSCFVPSVDGNLIIDPLPLDEPSAREIAERGGVAWVVLTNSEGRGSSRQIVERFGAKVAAVAGATLVDPQLDLVLREGDELGDAEVVTLQGIKSTDQIALYFSGRDRTLVVGDALWGEPAGSLSMQDRRLAKPSVAALSLRKLRALNPRNIILAGGAPIFGRAFEALNECLDGGDGAHVNITNFDELAFRRPRNGPAGYRSEWAEVGFLLGGSKLGYQVARLPPGEAFCPNHWHVGEEELFIVWEGEPTLHTPRGTISLRRGDIAAFPTNDRGAHRVTNESEQPCTILMIANSNSCDICFYPDSDKVLVEATGTLVRATPLLDYFDGEL